MASFEAYPQELSHIKLLLLRKQYHQCINASMELLQSRKEDGDQHPLSPMFATFYLALAHDDLARSMHEHSSYKLATFDVAERHYHRAIEMLPTLEACRTILKQQMRDDSGSDSEAKQLHFNVLEDKLPPRTNSASASTPPILDAPDGKDNSDLESHDSFDDFFGTDAPRLTLPRRPVLERDHSSMSLLQVQPKLTKSTSQGLLRPIRLGSPPKAHHLPPKLPYFGQIHSSQASRAPTPLPSPLPSPLPTAPDDAVEFFPKARRLTSEAPEKDLTRLSERLDGMATQISTHISLLRRAKLATTVAQAGRASRSEASRHLPQKRIPQSKSFWSFTPVNVKLAEKQKKIEEGRARGWERKRYRSEKYEHFAEMALAEL